MRPAASLGLGRGGVRGVGRGVVCLTAALKEALRHAPLGCQSSLSYMLTWPLRFAFRGSLTMKHWQLLALNEWKGALRSLAFGVSECFVRCELLAYHSLSFCLSCRRCISF